MRSDLNAHDVVKCSGWARVRALEPQSSACPAANCVAPAGGMCSSWRGIGNHLGLIMVIVTLSVIGTVLAADSAERTGRAGRRWFDAHPNWITLEPTGCQL